MLSLLHTALVLQVAALPPLSPFQQAKAESLLRNRLPCLGCHELGGEGGSVGPSLSELKRTRPREYVYSMIRDPDRVAPHSVMPRVPMAPETLNLIASYLVQREPTTPRDRRNSPTASADTMTPAGVYGRFCAACHGVGGRGDGFNARFLPVRPTAHADSSYMSRRPDDALFDAVYAGGFIMNRSNRMPPFGERLTREQIRGLVRHMRTLCRCEGPAWSRDDR